MEWVTIIGLAFFGICLIVIEVIFVPGTTFVGIAGFICLGLVIYLGYEYFDNTTGTIILISTFAGSITALVLAFKSNAWERFSLKGTNTGRFNEDFKVILTIGDEGKTISSLKPFGKAIFNDKEIEVRSNGEYIRENEPVKVTRIEPNKIFVTPINQTE